MALTEIDRNLLKRCVSGEPGAWKDFVNRFIGLFVHVINHTAHARSVPITPHDVDDLTAEVFLRLLANDFAVLRRFRGKSSLATYLTVVSRRVVVRELTKKRMAEALGHVNSHTKGTADSAAGPTKEQKRIENRETVSRLLEKLPPGDAEVVRQYHIEGKTYREISLQLGIPENSIGPMLTRARAKLRHASNVQT